jgi:DNA-binding response OmpR family regulator
VVDDDPIIRQFAMLALSRKGFECEPSDNGREAIELAKLMSYDLVVTDICMPEMNGQEVAAELLALQRRPVMIVVTGVDDDDLPDNLRKLGVSDVWRKPVNYFALAVKARALVEQRLAKNLAEETVQVPIPVAKSADSLSPDEEEAISRAADTTGGMAEERQIVKLRARVDRSVGTQAQASIGAIPSQTATAAANHTQLPTEPSDPVRSDVTAPAGGTPPAKSPRATRSPSRPITQQRSNVATQATTVSPRTSTGRTKTQNASQSTNPTTESLATKVSQVTQNLQTPPHDFDGFAAASGNSFNSRDLAEAVEGDPIFALEVLRMINSLIYNSNRAVMPPKNSSPVVNVSSGVSSVILFASGAIFGSLLSWLGAGTWLHQ